MIGKQILNYRIDELLGEGGMGSVYLASNVNIDQKVAVKVLNPRLTNNEEVKHRFEREAVTLALLDHPGVVKFLNYFEDKDGVYLIMEYVKGITLDNYIENVTGPIVEEKALNLFSQILDAFSYAHSKGVVHRDIKPSNILITPDQKIKVLDFGIARIISESVVSTTKVGTRMGTLMYMSPEQVKGKEVDRRSDIYSLGVVLHQMVTGKAPYDDTTLSEFDINLKVVEEKLPRAKLFYPYVSDKVQDVIDKAVEKDPDDRFQDCDAFKYQLTKAINPEIAVKPQVNPLYKRSAVVVGFLLLISLLWLWDYNRTKVKYFKHFVERKGVPEGIHKLSSNEVEHRTASYRFEYRRGKLVRLTRVNSAGKIREHSDSEHTEYPNDMRLYYTGSGDLDYADVLDRNGNILVKKDYNEHFTLVTFKQGDSLGTELALAARTVAIFKNPFSGDSEKGRVSRYVITNDRDGYVKKIQYANSSNEFVGDKDGIFGREYVRDDKGRVIEEHYLGADGKPKATKKGLAIKRHTFDENDDWVETRYMDVNSKLVTDEVGVPVIKLAHDEYGNRIKEEYYLENGELALRKDFKIAGFKYKIDEKGNQIEQISIGTDGKNCTNSSGVSGYLFKYDEFGNIIETTCINTDGKICFSNEAWAIAKRKFDNNGNVIEFWSYNEKDKLCNTKNGYCGYIQKHDARGNVTEFITYDENNKPVLWQGYAGIRAEYNNRNKMIKLTYLDTKLQPANSAENIAIIYYRYDKKGNLIGSSYYDKTGSKLQNSTSYHAGWNAVIDDHGCEIEREYYDADSLICNYREGYARLKAKFDAFGNRTEVRFYDKDGRLGLSYGYAGWNMKYDERGNIVEDMYIDPNGNCYKNILQRHKYDNQDNRTESSTHNCSGELVYNENGYCIEKVSYDKRNQEIKREYSDVNSQLIRTNLGYASYQKKYDERGNLTELSYYDEFGNLCKNFNNFSRQVSVFDKQGQLVKQSFFDEKGNPVFRKGAAPEIAYEYDIWGNIIGWAFYDGRGNRVKNEEGWSIRRRIFDVRGHILLESYFDENENSCMVSGYSKMENKYNSDNKIVESNYYGEDGQLRVNNFAFVRYTYNHQGDLAQIEYLDNKSMPCKNLNYCKMVYIYDNQGVLKSKKQYKADGSLYQVLDANNNYM